MKNSLRNCPYSNGTWTIYAWLLFHCVNISYISYLLYGSIFYSAPSVSKWMVYFLSTCLLFASAYSDNVASGIRASLVGESRRMKCEPVIWFTFSCNFIFHHRCKIAILQYCCDSILILGATYLVQHDVYLVG